MVISTPVEVNRFPAFSIGPNIVDLFGCPWRIPTKPRSRRPTDLEHASLLLLVYVYREAPPVIVGDYSVTNLGPDVL